MGRPIFVHIAWLLWLLVAVLLDRVSLFVIFRYVIVFWWQELRAVRNSISNHCGGWFSLPADRCRRCSSQCSCPRDSIAKEPTALVINSVATMLWMFLCCRCRCSISALPAFHLVYMRLGIILGGFFTSRCIKHGRYLLHQDGIGACRKCLHLAIVKTKKMLMTSNFQHHLAPCYKYVW